MGPLRCSPLLGWCLGLLFRALSFWLFCFPDCKGAVFSFLLSSLLFASFIGCFFRGCYSLRAGRGRAERSSLQLGRYPPAEHEPLEWIYNVYLQERRALRIEKV